MSLNSLRARRDIRRGNDSDYVMANLDELVRAKAANEGDTEFLKLLDDVEDLGLVSQSVGDNYDVSINNDMDNRYKVPKPTENYGKIELHRKDKHGLGDTPATLNAIMMALDSRIHGPVVQREGRLPTAEDIRLRQIVENQLSSRSTMELAGVGLRNKGSHLDWTDRVDRAGDRIVELSYGYNPITGAPHGGVPLEGGHRLPHSKYEDLSDARENMMFENNYENVIKGNRLGEAERQVYINRIKDKFVNLHPSPKFQPKLQAHLLANTWNIGKDY